MSDPASASYPHAAAAQLVEMSAQISGIILDQRLAREVMVERLRALYDSYGSNRMARAAFVEVMMLRLAGMEVLA
jgi:hypothetical protein